MNAALKKLFSPRNLATTVATGMLVVSAGKLWASGTYQVSACAYQLSGDCVGCQIGQWCYATDPQWGQMLYCCYPGDSCFGGYVRGTFPYGTAYCWDSD